MASPRFDNNIKRAARRLNDPRLSTLTDDTGKRYSHEILEDYQNEASKSLVRDTFKETGINFPRVMPEMVKTSSALSLTTGSVAAPSDAWLFLDLRSASYIFTKITDEISLVVSGQHPFIVASATRPYFYEEARTIKTLGITTGDVYGRYIILPRDMTIADATGDLELSAMWDDQIVDRMVQYGIADLKGALAVTQG